MEHRLITGGEQFLPFARSRIKALRATGLAYASQQFEIDGCSVKVRIEPGHEYITLSGGASNYLTVPSSLAHTQGIDPVRAKARPALLGDDGAQQLSLRVKEHVQAEAGHTDWRSKKTLKAGKGEIISYDNGVRSRYRMNTAQQNNLGAKPYLFINGNRRDVPHAVLGAGRVTATAASGNKHTRLMFAYANTARSMLYVCMKLPSGEWETLPGEYAIPDTLRVASAGFLVSGTANGNYQGEWTESGGGVAGALFDPVTFSPAEPKFITLITAVGLTYASGPDGRRIPPTSAQRYQSRVLRGEFTVTEDSAGVPTFALAFTLGEVRGSGLVGTGGVWTDGNCSLQNLHCETCVAADYKPDGTESFLHLRSEATFLQVATGVPPVYGVWDWFSPTDGSLPYRIVIISPVPGWSNVVTTATGRYAILIDGEEVKARSWTTEQRTFRTDVYPGGDGTLTTVVGSGTTALSWAGCFVHAADLRFGWLALHELGGVSSTRNYDVATQHINVSQFEVRKGSELIYQRAVMNGPGSPQLAVASGTGDMRMYATGSVSQSYIGTLEDGILAGNFIEARGDDFVAGQECAMAALSDNEVVVSVTPRNLLLNASVRAALDPTGNYRAMNLVARRKTEDEEFSLGPFFGLPGSFTMAVAGEDDFAFYPVKTY